MMTTLEKFKQLLDTTVPEIFIPADKPIPGDPYKSWGLQCGECGGYWEENQKQGTVGLVCPFCGDKDEEFIW